MSLAKRISDCPLNLWFVTDNSHIVFFHGDLKLSEELGRDDTFDYNGGTYQLIDGHSIVQL